jgi:hypothetical protein
MGKYVLEQARPSFLIVGATSVKFGVHAGNKQINT